MQPDTIPVPIGNLAQYGAVGIIAAVLIWLFAVVVRRLADGALERQKTQAESAARVAEAAERIVAIGAELVVLVRNSNELLRTLSERNALRLPPPVGSRDG